MPTTTITETSGGSLASSCEDHGVLGSTWTIEGADSLIDAHLAAEHCVCGRPVSDEPHDRLEHLCDDCTDEVLRDERGDRVFQLRKEGFA